MAATQARATVLVVDDDEAVLSALCRVLGRHGLAVLPAGGAAEALEAAAARPIDLALIDLVLPDGDGVGLARALRAGRPGLPLLLITAYPQGLDSRPDAADLFRRVLVKPLDLAELRRAVDEALTQPAAPRPTRPPMSHEAPPDRGPEPTPYPPPSPPRRSLKSAAVVVLALVVLAGGAVFMSGVPLPWQKDEAPPTVQAPPPLGVELVPAGDGVPDHTLRVPPDVQEALGIRPRGGREPVLEAVQRPQQGRLVVLPGTLLVEPSRIVRVRARFAPAEIVKVGTVGVPERAPSGLKSELRELRAGDTVPPGTELVEMISVDVGARKNDLYEAYVQWRLDKRILDRALEKGGASLPEILVDTYRRNVDTDRSTYLRALNALRTWNIPEEDIKEVLDEARKADLDRKRDDLTDREGEERLRRWGRVVVKVGVGLEPPRRWWQRPRLAAAGNGHYPVILERNLGEGEIVQDPTVNLFQLARLDRMLVSVNAPEDMVRGIEKLQGADREWVIRTAGAEGGIRARFDDVSYIVDPNQHSLVIKGHIDNPVLNPGEPPSQRRYLFRGGQYATATVELPPPDGVVEVPAAAVVEDGRQSIVFVQADPDSPDLFTMRRVDVTARFESSVWVRSRLRWWSLRRTAEERAEGLLPRQPLWEGEKLLTSGGLELKKELEDRETAAADKR
jgi:cobalt-zinc-cadmium efflux system membrane fusion protein